jgi:hypothetical protein
MRLTSKPLAVIIVVTIFGGIFFSSALGWWQTKSNKRAGTYQHGQYAGRADPSDIRGSYTFGDVEENFGLPAELLAQAFGVQTAHPAAFPVKSLEAMYLDSPQEVGTASLRLFVAFYLGLPIDLSPDIYLPEAAAAILRTRNLSAQYASYLEAHLVPNLSPAAAPLPGNLGSTPHAEGSAAQEGRIKGNTTFAELMEWGLEAEIIEQVLGMPMPAAQGMTVKDFCLQNGLVYGGIKSALQMELDKIQAIDG